MAQELRTLFWLQGKLLLAMFRSRRANAWARLGRMLLMGLLLLLSLPFFFAMGIGVAYLCARLSPLGAFELIALANTGMAVMWIVTPASYSSDMIERFEMTRLFVHPVSLGGLLTGSAAVSLVSFVGLWTVLTLLGEIVGLMWQAPLLLPVILAGGAAVLGMLVFAGRVMEDIFDLIASHRRLRSLLLFLLTLPFVLIFVANYAIQIAVRPGGAGGSILEPLLAGVPNVRGMGPIEGLDAILRGLQLSRYLLWLPTGWGAAGIALPVAGDWLRGLLFLGLSAVIAAGLWAVHGRLTLRLLHGAALRSGSERVRRASLDMQLPGPAALRALLAKDWIYLRRSPVTRRVLMGIPMIAVAFGFSLWQVTTIPNAPLALREGLPYLAAVLLLVSTNLATSSFTADYFGAVDREGFASLMLASVDRRWVLISANLIMMAFSLVQSLVLLVLVAVLSRETAVLAWGLWLAVCLNLSTLPFYNLASIISPYRAPYELMTNKNQGSFWTFLAWLLGTPPALICFLVPFFWLKEWQALALILIGVYSVVLWTATLGPLARLMERRAFAILEAVSAAE